MKNDFALFLNRHVRCVCRTMRTSVIIGKCSDIEIRPAGDMYLLVDIEGTMTTVMIDAEFWVIETLDKGPKIKYIMESNNSSPTSSFVS